MRNFAYGDHRMHMGIPVCKRAGIAKRGVETWGFHESPSYPHMMYCFLAWRES
jgi:hypothetical protein